MVPLQRNYITIVVLTLTLTAKAKLEMFPFCENDTAAAIVTGAGFVTPALKCYNYKSLPMDLRNPKEVKKFSIKSQYLEKLTSGEIRAANLISLEYLHLGENAIKTIEIGAFLGATLLHVLGLERNEIEEIDLRVFQDLLNLRMLFLNENPLKGFSKDEQFPPLNLTFLTLNDCKITSIPPKLFTNLEKLEKLWLNNNHLQILDWKVFPSLKSLKRVDLERNPFHCDCQVKFLLDFLDMKNVSFHRYPYKPPSCQSLSNSSTKILPGTGWHKIDRTLLVCPPEISSIHLSKPNKNQTLNWNLPGTISIECEYEGYPEPNVTWTKSQMPLYFRSGVTIATQLGDDTFPEFNYKFKQILTIPSSPEFQGSYGCQVAHDRAATLKVDANNLPGLSIISTTFIKLDPKTHPNATTIKIPEENKNSDLYFQVIIIILTFVVVLLLGVIAGSGIYIAVRYSKVKQKALPKKIYSTIPRESKPNSAFQRVMVKEDPPYPPLLGGQENVYEICGNDEDHIYEVPVIPRA